MSDVLFREGLSWNSSADSSAFRRYSQLGKNRTARKGTGGRGQTTVVSRGGASKLDWLWADDPRRCLEKSVG